RKAHVEFYLPGSGNWEILAGAMSRVETWNRFWVPETDNLRAATSWLIEHNRDDAVLICTALAYFWHGRGYHSEARNLIETVLTLPGAAEKNGYPKALIFSGLMAQVQGNMAEAGERFRLGVEAITKNSASMVAVPETP